MDKTVMALALAMFTNLAMATQDLVVKVARMESEAQVSHEYTGIVSYKSLIEIVTPVSGIVTQIAPLGETAYPKGDTLYVLQRNEPGYPEIRINNAFKGRVIKNTFFEVGEFVAQDQVVLTLVDPGAFKTSLNMLPGEVQQLQSNGHLSLEILQDIDTRIQLAPKGIKVHSPLENRLHYRVEVFFECTQACNTLNLAGKPAIVKIAEKPDKHYVPTHLLQDGMSSIFVLDANNTIAKRSIQLIEVDESQALIRQQLDEPIVYEFNRQIKVGDQPAKIIEL